MASIGDKLRVIQGAMNPERVKLLDDLREDLGTLPSMGHQPQTRFFRGVEGLEVNYVTGPANPYKGIFAFAPACWGNAWDTKKWRRLSPEARFLDVLATLSGKSIPNGMESASFTFEIAGCSRGAFDQIARQRLGVVFGSMGTRDNEHVDADFRIAEALWKNEDAHFNLRSLILIAKNAYTRYVREQGGNWQDAKAFLPATVIHRFIACWNFTALRNFAGQRLRACEQEDTVAVAWLVRERILERFPLLAAFLRPTCDWAKRCVYHDGDPLSESYSCLFKGCGRWPEYDDGYATFPTSCSDYETMQRQAGFTYFPGDAKLVPERYEDLDAKDRALFEED